MRPEELPDDVANELELKRGQGVLIATVQEHSPASDAGLKPFDVILSWDGVEFSDPTLLSRAIAATPIGTEIPVKLVRGSTRGPKEMELKVKVTARPPDDQ